MRMVRRDRRTVMVVVGSCALLGAACGTSGTDAGAGSSPSVIATTDIWTDVVSNVACDGLVSVTTLIPSGADPHAFEPSFADRSALDAASLVVANGLHLEGGVDDLLDDVASDGTPVLKISDHLPTLGEDPHVWWDPDGVRQALPAIADALVADVGLDRAAVDTCADAYDAELAAVTSDMDAILAVVPPENRLLVTSHDSLEYFAARFDFTVIGAVIPSSSTMAEADPASLSELTALIEDTGVRSIFAEPQHSADDTNALAARVSGVSVVMLHTGTLGDPETGLDTYAGFLRSNAQIIADALR